MKGPRGSCRSNCFFQGVLCAHVYAPEAECREFRPPSFELPQHEAQYDVLFYEGLSQDYGISTIFTEMNNYRGENSNKFN